MAIPFIDEYKKGINNFPDDNIAPHKKDEKWHLQVGKAILSEYANNRCGVGYNERDRITNNRNWANGENSEDTFKDIILEFKRDQTERISYAAMDFSIIPILSKFQSVFVGILSGIDHRIAANSTDPVSLRKKTKEKMRKWLKKVYAPQFAGMDAMLGVPQNEEEFIPKSKAELEMFDQFGGFKLGIEIAMEVAAKHCFATSRWDNEIRPQFYRDYFTNNMMACKDYFDETTYTIKQSYVDIKDIIVQNTGSPSFEGAKYIGRIKYINVSDLRSLTANTPGWTEDRILRIAKKYSNVMGNNPDISWGVGNQYGPFSSGNSAPSYGYDPYLIPVAELEYKTILLEYDVEKVDQSGNKSYYKTDRDRNYNREDRKSITTPIVVWHKLSMVIGCDDVFDYGLQHDIPRPKYEDARSSFHFYRNKGKSYCERAIPHAKQIQLMYLKVQALGLKAVPPGMAVDWGSLKGMMMNNKEIDPMEIFKIYWQTGMFMHNPRTQRSYATGAGAPPLRELRGTYTLADLLAVVSHHKAEIRELTGIDESAGRGEATAYQAMIKSKFTDISLKESYIAYVSVLQECAINCIARLRDLLSYSEKAREIYGPIIGLTNMELLDMVSDLPSSQIAVIIEAEATDENKEQLRNAAIAAMKPGKEGVPVLRFSDYLFIERLISSGNIKYGHAYIANKESEIERMGIERAKVAKQEDTNMAIAVSQSKAQDELQTLTGKTNEEIRAYQEKINEDMKRDKKLHEQAMELKQMELDAMKIRQEATPAI